MKKSFIFRLIAFLAVPFLLVSCEGVFGGDDEGDYDDNGGDYGHAQYYSLADFKADGSFVPNTIPWFIDDSGALTKENAANLVATIKKERSQVSLEFSEITSIGDAVFKDCEYLSGVQLHKVTEVGASAFEGCSLRDITVSEATKIGDRAFADNDLMYVFLPQVYDFGVEIFDGNQGIQRIYFESNADYEISEDTFAGIDTESIKLDLSVSKFQYRDYMTGGQPYHGDFEDSRPQVAIDNRTWCGKRWASICDADERQGYSLSDFEEYLVPDYREPWFIEDEVITKEKCDGLRRALWNCAYDHKDARVRLFFLNATSIGEGALELDADEEYDALRAVVAPNVVSIGANAFKNRKELERINFASATTIGANAFSGITQLYNVCLESEKNISIDPSAFADSGLSPCYLYVNDNKFTTSTPKVADDNRTWGGFVWSSGVNGKQAYVGFHLSDLSKLGDKFYGDYYLIRDSGTITQEQLSPFLDRIQQDNVVVSLYFPYATGLGDYALDLGFSNEKINEIIAPKVTTLGKGAFKNNARLYRFDLPLVTEISDELFFGTDILGINENMADDEKYCKLGTITSIGKSAFEKNEKMYYAAFKEVKTVGDRAFADCDYLQSIGLEKANKLGSEIASGCDSVRYVMVTAKGDIALESDTFAGFDTTKCTLRLCIDKLPDNYYFGNGSKAGDSINEPSVGYERPYKLANPQTNGNMWGGVEWERIVYREYYEE